MSIYLIAALIIIGLILLLVEFLVLPGISVAGIAGFILISIAIYFSYQGHDAQTGHIVLISTILLSLGVFALSFREGTWKLLMLNTNADSKVDINEQKEVNIGDEGISISRLNPIGKVIIKGKYYEAKSLGSLIDENKEITVIKISGNTLIVKLKIND